LDRGFEIALDNLRLELGINELCGLAVGSLVLATYRASQAAIGVGMRFLEIADGFEIDALDLG